jgi:hypothetical protein
MSMKSVLAVAALTMASVSTSWAAGGALTFVPNVTPPSSTASFSATVNGTFNDTWMFNVAPPGASLGTSITNISFGLTGGISSFAGTLASTPLNFGSSSFGPVVLNVLAGFTGTLTPGAYTLTVSGNAGSGASYGGNVVLTPVPEPETYALMLAGLGAVGFVASRRRPRV